MLNAQTSVSRRSQRCRASDLKWFSCDRLAVVRPGDVTSPENFSQFRLVGELEHVACEAAAGNGSHHLDRHRGTDEKHAGIHRQSASN